MNTTKLEIIWRARGRNNKQHAVKSQSGYDWIAFCGIKGGPYYNSGSDKTRCRKCLDAVNT